MENIIENNKLIAEFMGSVCEMVDHTEGNEDYCKSEGIERWLIPTWSKPQGFKDEWGWGKYRMGYWEYHSSWDWLMPVVEKAMKTDMHSEGVENLLYDMTSAFHNVSINELYNAVVEFIKWYNTNCKTN